MRRTAVAIACCGLGLGVPAGSAAADGGPVPPSQGGTGATAPGSPYTYVALGARGSTVVAQVKRAGGAVWGSRVLPGAWGVPGIAFDGSTAGLSADGRTLVLAGLTRRYPPRQTRIAVLDAHRLRVSRTFALRGFFTVDAVSPAGRWLYFIHYGSPASPLSYEVRAYDLRARRLLAKPVVDPREPDEDMQGLPLTRSVSADGRWAYTLYMRPDGPMFVHALDTARRTAACVDLPLDGRDVDTSVLRLAPGGGALRVVQDGRPLATIDTRTWAVRRAGVAPAGRTAPAARVDDGGAPWALLAAIPLAAGLAVAGGAAAARRRRRGAVAG